MTTNDSKRSDNHWYHQPIAWLGIAVTLILLSACIWTVVVSTGYTDVPVEGNTRTLLHMPMPAASSSEGGA